MIFWYLNKKTNKWHKANLDQATIDKYDMKFDVCDAIPNHENKSLPTLDMLYSDGGEQPDGTYKPITSTLVVRCSSGGPDQLPYMMKVQVTEENADEHGKIVYENYNTQDLSVIAKFDPVFGDYGITSSPDPIVWDHMRDWYKTDPTNKFDTEVNTVHVNPYDIKHGHMTPDEVNASRLAHKRPKTSYKWFDNKVKALFDSGKVQRSKYSYRKDHKLVCYINRDGLAVSIERSFAGGYTKTIGLGLDKQGHVTNVAGVKRRGQFWSWREKDIYNDAELANIKAGRDSVAQGYNGYLNEPIATVGGKWDGRLQNDFKFVKSTNTVTLQDQSTEWLPRVNLMPDSAKPSGPDSLNSYVATKPQPQKIVMKLDLDIKFPAPITKVL